MSGIESTRKVVFDEFGCPEPSPERGRWLTLAELERQFTAFIAEARAQGAPDDARAACTFSVNHPMSIPALVVEWAATDSVLVDGGQA